MRSTAIAILILAAPGLAPAQDYGGRAGTWELSVVGLYQQAEKTTAGGGSLVDTEDAFGLGIGFGYYPTEHLALGADFEWLTPDYTATLVGDNGATSQFDHELVQINYRFKGAYYFLEGPFQPYAELGAGWTYVDSNVANGPPIVGCWWHPYFGEICDGYYDTFDETSFTYGGALGLRYEFRGGTIVRVSYNNYEVDGSGDAPDPTLNAARLEIAWEF